MVGLRPANDPVNSSSSWVEVRCCATSNATKPPNQTEAKDDEQLRTRPKLHKTHAKRLRQLTLPRKTRTRRGSAPGRFGTFRALDPDVTCGLLPACNRTRSATLPTAVAPRPFRAGDVVAARSACDFDQCTRPGDDAPSCASTVLCAPARPGACDRCGERTVAAVTGAVCSRRSSVTAPTTRGATPVAVDNSWPDSLPRTAVAEAVRSSAASLPTDDLGCSGCRCCDGSGTVSSVEGFHREMVVSMPRTGSSACEARTYVDEDIAGDCGALLPIARLPTTGLCSSADDNTTDASLGGAEDRASALASAFASTITDSARTLIRRNERKVCETKRSMSTKSGGRVRNGAKRNSHARTHCTTNTNATHTHLLTCVDTGPEGEAKVGDRVGPPRIPCSEIVMPERANGDANEDCTRR